MSPAIKGQLTRGLQSLTSLITETQIISDMLVAVSLSLGALVQPTMRVGARANCPRMSISGEERLLQKFGVPTAESMVTNRRSALGLGLAAAAVPLVGFSDAAVADDGMFSLPPLPYAYVRTMNPTRARPLTIHISL